MKKVCGGVHTGDSPDKLGAEPETTTPAPNLSSGLSAGHSSGAV